MSVFCESFLSNRRSIYGKMLNAQSKGDYEGKISHITVRKQVGFITALSDVHERGERERKLKLRKMVERESEVREKNL